MAIVQYVVYTICYLSRLCLLFFQIHFQFRFCFLTPPLILGGDFVKLDFVNDDDDDDDDDDDVDDDGDDIRCLS